MVECLFEALAALVFCCVANLEFKRPKKGSPSNKPIDKDKSSDNSKAEK